MTDSVYGNPGRHVDKDISVGVDDSCTQASLHTKGFTYGANNVTVFKISLAFSLETNFGASGADSLRSSSSYGVITQTTYDAL